MRKKPKDYKRYIMFTNVWNEENKIENMFEMVFNFTLRPDLYVIINDGSTDGTEYIVNKCIEKYGITMPTVMVSLPPKKKGELSKIGQAYNFVFDVLKLKDMDFEFMSIVDVDSGIHPDYFNKVSTGFMVEPHIGVISGTCKGIKLKVPMGSSKAIRWSIVKNIERFWDPAPDMQLNIEAEYQGYNWLILEHEIGFVNGPISARNRTSDGSYYAGKLWRYVGGSYYGMIQRVIYRMLRRRHGLAFLKGFKENKDWMCTDKKIIRYYKSRVSCFNDLFKRIWQSLKKRII